MLSVCRWRGSMSRWAPYSVELLLRCLTPPSPAKLFVASQASSVHCLQFGFSLETTTRHQLLDSSLHSQKPGIQPILLQLYHTTL
ncbi:hypothetical protein AB1N83_013833 [Pleurotus pulmonarius]